MYEYRCKIVNVYDGDTATVDIDLGFKSWRHSEKVRIGGIDTPEIRTRNKREKVFGYLARARMRELLPDGSIQILRTYSPKPDKYGRILGNFVIDAEVDLLASKVLITERLAVLYHGQNKKDVQDEHEANWDYLDSQGDMPMS